MLRLWMLWRRNGKFWIYIVFVLLGFLQISRHWVSKFYDTPSFLQLCIISHQKIVTCVHQVNVVERGECTLKLDCSLLCLMLQEIFSCHFIFLFFEPDCKGPVALKEVWAMLWQTLSVQLHRQSNVLIQPSVHSCASNANLIEWHK